MFMAFQKEYMKTSELNAMRDALGNEGDTGCLEQLRKYLRTSSTLSFAARAEHHTDSDLEALNNTGREYVSTGCVCDLSCCKSIAVGVGAWGLLYKQTLGQIRDVYLNLNRWK